VKKKCKCLHVINRVLRTSFHNKMATNNQVCNSLSALGDRRGDIRDQGYAAMVAPLGALQAIAAPLTCVNSGMQLHCDERDPLMGPCICEVDSPCFAIQKRGKVSSPSASRIEGRELFPVQGSEKEVSLHFEKSGFTLALADLAWNL